MPKLVILTATLITFLFAAAPDARAALNVSGTLDIGLGTLPSVGLAGSGIGSSAGAGAAATIPANLLSGFATVPIAPPLSTLIDDIGIAGPGIALGGALTVPASNQTLVFDGTSGTMGLNASAYLLMAGGVVTEIPLAVVGAGGTQMFHVLTIVAGTVSANPYQLGMVTLMGSLNGNPHTALGTGIDNRTAAGKGTLVLVTPTVVNMGVLGTIASISTLTLTYVPEPGTLLLLGGGVAWLAAAGRRRRS
jgi:hypothetical protein